MDNNQSQPTTFIGLISMWCMTIVTNFLAFAPTINLDTVQKIAAITASIVLTIVTIATYFKKKK